MTLSRLPVLALLLFATGAVAQEPEISPSWPKWLQDAMRSESANIKPTVTQIGDSHYTTAVAGKPGNIEALERGWYVPSDIGTGATLDCYIFDDEKNLAELLMLLADAHVELVAEANTQLNAKSIYYLGAGAIDSVPYVALEWLYNVGPQDAPLIAHTKARAATVGNVSVSCVHDAIGNRKAFADAFDAFIRNFDYPSGIATPYYREIHVHSVGDQPVGVAWSTFTKDEDGDTVIRTSDATLFPVDSSTLSYSDSTSVSYSLPDGYLINEFFSVAENGELTTDLSLDYTSEAGWIVEGTFQGKAVEFTIDGDASPLSSLGQMQATAALFASEDAQTELIAWVPSVDPTNFQPFKVSRDPGSDARIGKIALGPMQIDATFDAVGSIETGAISIGALQMHIDRTWMLGDLSQANP